MKLLIRPRYSNQQVTEVTRSTDFQTALTFGSPSERVPRQVPLLYAPTEETEPIEDTHAQGLKLPRNRADFDRLFGQP